MIIGINTNVAHNGQIFHVQTEDGGLDLHTITTILFKNGAILSSKKTSYKDMPESSSSGEVVKEKMEEQHKQMIRDLVRGKLGPAVGSAQEKSSPETQVPKKGLTNRPEKVLYEEKSNPAKVRKEGLDGLIFDYLAKKKTDPA